MKILDIRFKNLNSLRGQWHIDFNNRAYSSGGIFLITGPTGAGKTTIFDAVCLALYAQTPRLGKISGTVTNEIMTRKTKDCYAQVIFEAEGKNYIAAWSQHRADLSNKLQQPKHILSLADSGEILTDKASETSKKIEEITGLDFKRFTQAVLLEQGGFDAFLKADKNERAKILELLTGSEIYGEISARIYERAKQEKIKLENLKIQRDSLKTNENFSSEEEIINSIAENQNELAKLEENFKKSREAIDWLRSLKKIQHELDSFKYEEESLNKRAEIFEADNKKLEAGLRARDLVEKYSALTAQRKSYETIASRIKESQSRLASDQSELTKIEKQQLPKLQDELKRLKRNIPEGNTPEGVCASAKELLKNYQDTYSKAKDIYSRKNAAEKNFKISQAAFENSEQEYSKAREVHYEAMKKLSDLMNTRASAILEDARRNLKPGTPCPVCGSLEHPAASHLNEENDSNENQEEILKFDEALKLLRDKEAKARKNFDVASKNLSIAQGNHSAARVNRENLSNAFTDSEKAVKLAKNAADEVVKFTGIEGNNLKEILQGLDNWLNEIKNYEKVIESLNENIKVLADRCENYKNSLAEENKKLADMTGELEGLESDFKKNLTEKNFDSEESFKAARLPSDLLTKLENSKKKLDEDKIKLQAQLNNASHRLEAEREKNITADSLETLEPRYRELEGNINVLKKKISYLEKDRDEWKRTIAQREDLNKKYNEQGKIFEAWDGLNDLIGSSKGDKFRIFAQRITLEMMIGLANIQLERMNGRYILALTPGDGELKLSVIDNEQAGEIRPTENLSGGERFIISLALALGLSHISGSKTGIDSLFLDEGFGSLDEEALSTALEALGEVQREGRGEKIIGIISHVRALRERIPTQINVIPKREGCSLIKGQGVSNF